MMLNTNVNGAPAFDVTRLGNSEFGHSNPFSPRDIFLSSFCLRQYPKFIYQWRCSDHTMHSFFSDGSDFNTSFTTCRNSHSWASFTSLSRSLFDCGGHEYYVRHLAWDEHCGWHGCGIQITRLNMPTMGKRLLSRWSVPACNCHRRRFNII